MSLLHNLHWRYATQQFDTEKIIPEETITDLLKGMNLAPSSYGLQPYEFIVIHDKALQKKLVEHSYNQEKVAQASHVIVIAAKTSISEHYIDEYIHRIADIQNKKIADLSIMKKGMMNAVVNREKGEQKTWAMRQCYIPLGVLVALCAEMHIDAGPMEGFVPEDYNRILGLDEHGLHATVVIPLGYRSESDQRQHQKKVRRKLDDIVNLRY